MTKLTKRGLIRAGLATAVAAGFPAIVPSTVFGQHAPSKRINVGTIGCGRIARGHDMPEVLKDSRARIVAVSDVEAHRLEEGKQFVNDFYAKQTGKPYDGVKTFANYRDLLADKDIDAVIVSTPDHWHALMGIHAVEAGKDVYLQKPASLTIAEGRALSNAVNASGRILQIGSQQRTNMPQFRKAAEWVRNGRIGQITRVEIGLPGDPAGGDPTPQPIPAGLDYDAWLGSTPYVPYTLDRVHPRTGYDRPGWLRLRQFGAGMITGWGSHHIDSAHWGMDTEYTGPIEVWLDHVEYPTSGLWDVHGKFQTEALYANGVRMSISGAYPNGIKYIGTKGWLFVSRGDAAATASDPKSGKAKALDASDPKILTSVIAPDEVKLYTADEQHTNWLDCIISRKPPISPAEMGHRACSTCLVHDIAMVLKRKLYWDPVAERFKNDDEANAMLSRPMRAPYVI
ncbi:MULTISPECIES: Gfo/Idh/MocA family protein [Asticcacaulis]|uniref:Gfo/Idh/MocA family protein n=1 Tax=Asticcacaulis TaxID=76890 RepID=UPI001AE3F23F|nr:MULTISPECIES: Gfo/Idh/MocA family oxidoreductase [Asticcacaulis]MBP2159182.1 putative dehydrogenase [Asticcacaulis solisilvae]MDR6800227.1 putative dehydrogenase [Asticcacaulis sp. BE141]